MAFPHGLHCHCYRERLKCRERQTRGRLETSSNSYFQRKQSACPQKLNWTSPRRACESCLPKVHTDHLPRSGSFFVQCFIVFKYTLICFMQFLQHSISSSTIKGNLLVFCKVKIKFFLFNTSNIKWQNKDSDPNSTVRQKQSKHV